MTENVDFDLVIVGAGLSGLSVACWLIDLADRPEDIPRVCLLEPRQFYDNDRTWCFWDGIENPFNQLITHRWNNWQVGQADQVARQTSSCRPYVMLAAGDVYQYAQQCIECCPSMILKQGQDVLRVETYENRVLVETADKPLRARAVIDTRPPAHGALHPDSGFWQVFSGSELYCPDHGLDTGTAQLMDFQDCSDHPCFIYLLPLDADRVIVEWTEFHPDGVLPDCRARLNSWLTTHPELAGDIIRLESGILPMFPIRPGSSDGPIVRAGVGAGWMRAATGYHFATCQRGARDLAEQVLAACRSGNWNLSAISTRPAWLDWMDKVFLRALRDNPESAPDWFMRLFQNTSAAQIARFMNDEPRWMDACVIANALPKLPFLKAACRA